MRKGGTGSFPSSERKGLTDNFYKQGLLILFEKYEIEVFTPGFPVRHASSKK